MTQNVEELLTYEIYRNDLGECHLSIPVQNLIQPKFMIKNMDLYIFLHSYTQGYVIKNLPNYLLDSIMKKECFLTENLSMDLKQKYIISLI